MLLKSQEMREYRRQADASANRTGEREGLLDSTRVDEALHAGEAAIREGSAPMRSRGGYSELNENAAMLEELDGDFVILVHRLETAFGARGSQLIAAMERSPETALDALSS